MRTSSIVLSSIILGLALTGCAAPSAAPAPPIISDSKDQIILQKFLAHARAYARATTVEHCRKMETPEMFCWLDLPQLDLSLTAYELTGDPARVADFVAGFENLRSCLSPGPDGLLGWRGKAIEDSRDPARPNVVIDEVQVDFRAVIVLAHFVDLVDRDPALRQKYAALRDQYLDLAENHFAKKWDVRGYYIKLGDRGAICHSNPDNIPTAANSTLSHQDHDPLIEALLDLYCITGRDEYAIKAVRLGTWLKKCLSLTNDHYVWNFWDPAGPWDVHPTDPAKWKCWLGREPKGGFYTMTVNSALNLYQHGLVFDRTDVDRFLRTQMEVCWNGDLVHPVFANTDGKVLPKERMVAPSLAPFNAKLAELLYGPAAQDERVAKADNDWQGGMINGQYLREKYLFLPQALAGRPLYEECANKFLAKPANRALVEKLKFEVVAPGYQTPFTPAQMK